MELKRAVAIWGKAHEPEHPRGAYSLSALGVLYASQRDYTGGDAAELDARVRAARAKHPREKPAK